MSQAICPSIGRERFVLKIRENWLTRKPHARSSFVAGFSIFVLLAASFLFWTDTFNASSWMTAIPENVFTFHEYWRLWTALLAHADPVHLLSNSLLFFSFAYLLFGHFGSWVFPLGAFLCGGLTNFIVLTTLPSNANLLGASGMVYWMGAVWLTLYFCLESRDKISRRALKAIGVGLILFIPETIQANVSYLSHFVGFVTGVTFALFYYELNRGRFLSAQVVELVSEDEISSAP